MDKTAEKSVIEGKIENNKVILEGTGLRSLLINIPEIAESVHPGQMVHIKCGDANLLRRPFSVAGSDGHRIIHICYDIRGKGTEWLAEQKAGDFLSVLGPVGKGYTVNNDKHPLLVGGGTGIYSLLSLASIYKEKAEAIFGFRTTDLINTVGDFSALGTVCDVITDDGTSGKKGVVTDLLREKLSTGKFDIIYTCGPKAMMAGVASIADEFGIECEVSMEERMGCGIGACQACVCLTHSSDGDRYRRVCIDGPVFDSKEIVW